MVKVIEILNEFGNPPTNPRAVPFTREEQQEMHDSNAYIEVGMRKKPAIVKFQDAEGNVSYRADVHGHDIIEDNIYAAIKKFFAIKQQSG